MRLSPPTLLFGFYIVLSASFTQQIFNFFFKTFGKAKTAFGLGIVFIFVGILIGFFIFKKPINLKRKISFLILFILGLFLGSRLPIIAERTHVLEYGLLAWLTMKDATKMGLRIKAILFSFLIILGFGLLDEGFQYLLPYRVGEIHDVYINLVSGCWGMVLFLICMQKEASERISLTPQSR